MQQAGLIHLIHSQEHATGEEGLSNNIIPVDITTNEETKTIQKTFHNRIELDEIFTSTKTSTMTFTKTLPNGRQRTIRVTCEQIDHSTSTNTTFKTKTTKSTTKRKSNKRGGKRKGGKRETTNPTTSTTQGSTTKRKSSSTCTTKRKRNTSKPTTTRTRKRKKTAKLNKY